MDTMWHEYHNIDNDIYRITYEIGIFRNTKIVRKQKLDQRHIEILEKSNGNEYLGRCIYSKEYLSLKKVEDKYLMVE